MNFKLIKDFISTTEQTEVLNYGELQQDVVYENIENIHVKAVNEQIKGSSITCDMTGTEISKAAAKYQGDTTCVPFVPELFYNIKDRISNEIGINKEHVFFQFLQLKSGGAVPMHYDVSAPGYITYKCNIPVIGPETDEVYIDKSIFSFPMLSLYCFEANLYKHWANACAQKRIILSYGFIVPYADLGWKESDGRVRLSNKLWKIFIKKPHGKSRGVLIED
jgi:hypothetical protein